jgi:nitrate reductase NapAB chaperone NapD
MPIFSYLAIPLTGAKELLSTALARLPYCTVVPAHNHDVVVLVTDTPNQSAEEALQKELQALPLLQSLSLVFGYDQPTERT